MALLPSWAKEAATGFGLQNLQGLLEEGTGAEGGFIEKYRR